jgi:hypothetical protein
MVNKEVIQSVYRIKYNSEFGTCFQTIISSKQYLITAKHIFSKKNHNDSIDFEIFHDNKWNAFNGKLLIHNNSNIDIAVIDLNGISFYRSNNVELSKASELFASQDCYFLGFPFNLYSDMSKTNDNFPIPFIKKAIFSLFTGTESNEKILYLDGHNNPGFSGGPVVANIISENKLKICSIISAYVVQSNKLEKTSLIYGENSGIIVTYSAEYIPEIINRK